MLTECQVLRSAQNWKWRELQRGISGKEPPGVGEDDTEPLRIEGDLAAPHSTAAVQPSLSSLLPPCRAASDRLQRSYVYVLVDDNFKASSQPREMAAGKRAEEPTNSYLRQFLTRGEGDRQEQPKRFENTNTYGDGNNSNESEGCRSNNRQGDDDNCRQSDDDSDDVARELRLPTPRSPPQRPTYQPPSPQTELDPGCMLGAVLDSGHGLERTTVRYPSAASSKHKDGGSGSGQRTRQDQAVGIGDPPRGQQKDFMVDGEDLLRLRKSADAVGYRSSAAYNDSRGQQRQTHSKSLASSSLDLHHRHGAGLSTRAADGQQHHQNRNDRSKSGGHALSAQESSTLFWEEVDSLDAKISSANNDWGQRLGGGRGRGGDGNNGGESMATLGVHNGRSRGEGRSGRGGRGSGARGPPKHGVRQAAAFATPVVGGGSVRKRHSRAFLTSTELPLGQVLRTVGGLVGGEGLKVSAVR